MGSIDALRWRPPRYTQAIQKKKASLISGCLLCVTGILLEKLSPRLSPSIAASDLSFRSFRFSQAEPDDSVPEVPHAADLTAVPAAVEQVRSAVVAQAGYVAEADPSRAGFAVVGCSQAESSEPAGFPAAHSDDHFAPVARTHDSPDCWVPDDSPDGYLERVDSAVDDRSAAAALLLDDHCVPVARTHDSPDCWTPDGYSKRVVSAPDDCSVPADRARDDHSLAAPGGLLFPVGRRRGCLERVGWQELLRVEAA